MALPSQKRTLNPFRLRSPIPGKLLRGWISEAAVKLNVWQQHGLEKPRVGRQVGTKDSSSSPYPKWLCESFCVSGQGGHFIFLPLFLPELPQSLSCVQFFVTPWTSARQALLSFTISQGLLKFTSIKLVISSKHLVLCYPLLRPSIFCSIGVFSNESALHIRWPKFWSLSFSISPSNEYSGFFSFRIDWFDIPAVQGLSRVFFSTTIWKHQFLSTQPSLWSNSHIHAWLLEKP